MVLPPGEYEQSASPFAKLLWSLLNNGAVLVGHITGVACLAVICLFGIGFQVENKNASKIRIGTGLTNVF